MCITRLQAQFYRRCHQLCWLLWALPLGGILVSLLWGCWISRPFSSLSKRVVRSLKQLIIAGLIINKMLTYLREPKLHPRAINARALTHEIFEDETIFTIPCFNLTGLI